MALKVCITGGTGFLGSHVARVLESRGVSVRPLGRKDGDLRNPQNAMALLKDADRVVHLAADVGGVGYLKENGSRVYHDNMLIGMNVIRAVCAGRASSLVVASSPCCYPANSPLPLREDGLTVGVPTGDTAAYAYSKLGISSAADAFCAAAGKDVVSFIPSNLYGPGDNFEPHVSHVAAALLRKALVADAKQRPTFEVWGDGSATRDFVFVEDVAVGVAEMVLRDKPFGGGVYNLGSGLETPIRKIAETVALCIGMTVAPVFLPEKPVGYLRRVLCIEKSSGEFGFRPKTTLEDGLRKTIAWIRESGKLQELLADS
jgi:GDP-L-fucose synthase